MGEPIAGRVTSDQKAILEAEAEHRGLSVSELTGAIVEQWVREHRDDTVEKEKQSAADVDLEETYDELEAIRQVLEVVAKDAKGVDLQPWVERQIFNERRGWSETDSDEHQPAPSFDSLEEATDYYEQRAQR
jgi:hypothetical protein